MLTRRDALAKAFGAGALLRSRAAFAKAAQPSTPVNFDVPPHACDSHTHIFGDPAKFPFYSGRVYTPESALPEEMAALHRALHIERVVIVTPSVYGTDNSATLFGMKARGATARGIAVIDEKTPESDLEAMSKAGFRGIRINAATGGTNDPSVIIRRFQASVERIRKYNWHVQINTTPPVIKSLKEVVQSSPVPVVFDHMGGALAAGGLEQPGFADMLDLLRSGRAYMKVSGAYHASNKAPDYPDVIPIAKALIGANPDRILWGTDWPHPPFGAVSGRKATEVTPLHQIDDGALLNQLAVWAPDPAVRKKILVDNPTRLFGF
jgi:predicted TIM-barrel fold metal-dependent hydrolase